MGSSGRRRLFLTAIAWSLVAAQGAVAQSPAAPPQARFGEPEPVMEPPVVQLDAPAPLPGAVRPVLQSPVPAGHCGADCRTVVQGPILAESEQAGRLPNTSPLPEYQQLPINLATALRLADARPLVIAAAQASLRVSLAQLDAAKALWLPNVYVGGSYYYHGGGGVGNAGILYVNSRSQALLGAGVAATLSVADAIFAPLALQQVIQARQFDVQTARNDALRQVAESYFNVQEARGRLAGLEDAVSKSQELSRRIKELSKDLVAPVEVNRALTELADLEQELATARGQWRVTSADLTRLLRLNPSSVVVPLEPPYLQVTLISPQEPVDALVPIGLTNRPELASQQALVQATLVRLRQEKLRPLIPSVVLLGNPVPSAPGGFLMGGAFGSSLNGQSNSWVGRIDPSVQVLWELRNMGMGNLALIRERQAETQQAEIDLFRVQDRVAAEVVQAQSQVEAAAVRITRAEAGVKEAQINFKGNLTGIAETIRPGPLFQMVNRPQEAVAALRQLMRAYDNYFASVNEYNRAQFRLFYALGYPAGILACERNGGPLQPVDTHRPPQMAPVHGPEPCVRPYCP